MPRRTATVNWLTDDEQRAWRAFLLMHTRLTGRLNRDLTEQSNLSDADYGVLVNLSEATGGRMRAFELASEMEWEKSRLSHHLTRMARRGLVRREECPTDARGAFIALTDAGWTTIRAAAPKHVDSVRRYFFDALTPAQLTALTKVSKLVVAGIEDAEDRNGC